MHPGQLLAGPQSINETLYNVVANFPLGQGVDLSNYSNQFVFESSFDAFQNHVATQYGSVSPGALWMTATPAIRRMHISVTVVSLPRC